jgi:methyl-accepting chemotaxis protein-1 (serine sensor receptor)
MLNNLTIKSLLIFVIGFLSVLLVGSGVAGLYSLSSSNDSMRTIYEDRLMPMAQLDAVIRLLDKNRMSIVESLNGDPSMVAKRMDEVGKRSQEIQKNWEAYTATYLTDEEKKIAAKATEDYKKFVAEGLKPAVEALRSVNVQQAMEIVAGPMNQYYVPLENGVDALIKLQQNVAQSEFQKSVRMYDMVRNIAIAAILFGVLLGALLGYWLIQAICRPLEYAVAVAKRVAAGDLDNSITVNSTNETGQLLLALQGMNGSLVNIVGQVRSGTDTMATASSQIAAGNLDLSSRTEQQASSLEETASSMEELTSTVKQNADNARQANQLAMTASDVAVKGGAVVSQVVSTMGSINDSSRKIVDIISVIDGIAFQTNILALNAAVEAARAGEQGRGFAVVATEVRSLAQRSAAAAKEIKALIGDSVDKVNVGSKLVGEAGATMDEVVASVKRVTDIMGEITAASQEQSAGIEQVNQAIAQMDQVTQQNAALVEEAAAAAESLQDQASALANVVSVFKLGMNEQTTAVTRPTLVRQSMQVKRLPPKSQPKAMAAMPQPAAKMKKLAVANGDEWEEF